MMPDTKEKVKKFWRKVLRIFIFFKPYWKVWIFLFCVSLLLSALGLANPLIIKFLIDNVLVTKNYALLQLLMLVFTGLTLVSTGVRIVVRYAYAKLELSVLYDVRNTLFGHIEAMGPKFFEQKKVGDLLTRLGSDISGIEEFISLVFNGFIANSFSLIALFSISLYLSWKITVITLVVIPFYIASQRLYAGRLRKFYGVIKRQSAALTSFFEEKLSAIALVQIFGREEYELQEERRQSERLIGASLHTTLTSSIAGTIIGLLTFTALLFVLWYGGYQVIAGELTLGGFIAIYSYLGGLFSPIEAIVGLYTGVQSSLASVDRVFQILDIAPTVRDEPDAVPLPHIKGSVIFDHVRFDYGRKLILKDVSFHVSPGEVVGIVGESGTGKTTIIQLLSRFYDPASGDVIIDGHNTRHAALRSLRQRIGIASQNVVLFNATIRENLSYGRPRGAGMREIEAAAREAAIHDTIMALPHKYRTPLGEKGMTLSGGERQRLAIARLILKRPDLVVLDEATSFLDFKTELQVLRNLRSVFAGKTMFIIAHRLSTLEDASRILVLKGGRIVEDGDFKTLLARKGEFFNLYRYQDRGAESR